VKICSLGVKQQSLIVSDDQRVMSEEYRSVTSVVTNGVGLNEWRHFSENHPLDNLCNVSVQMMQRFRSIFLFSQSEETILHHHHNIEHGSERNGDIL